MPNLRRSNTLSRRAMALGLGLAGLAAACTQPGATTAPTDAMMAHSPAPTDAMMAHSPAPTDAMMEHSPAPTDAMMEHSATP